MYRAHRRFIGPNIHQPKLLHPLVILNEAKDLSAHRVSSFADAVWVTILVTLCGYLHRSLWRKEEERYTAGRMKNYEPGGTVMEAVYYAARANLRRLMRLYPQWTQPQYAQAVGISRGWVKKWKKRLQEAEPEDEQVLYSRSRARKHPPERISQVVVERILQMRDQPPEGLGRTPGPKALLYYLARDVELAATGQRLPRSSRTIYRLLRQAGRKRRRVPAQHEPLERPAPMSQWQLDF